MNYLDARYSAPDRLPPSVPFEALPPSSEFKPHLGEVSLYSIGDSYSASPELVCHFRVEDDKPQHALWRGGHLWMLGIDHLTVYDAELNPVARIEDPWLAGGHTAAVADDGQVLLSCAASDSVLVVDTGTHRVVDALRLPEALYGRNYPLERTDSVVDHFIPNDLQLTHVNCAWPWRGGILTSALIPGALGWFDSRGDYHELLRGFVGCHGARVRADTGEIYFCDSCAGMIVFLDDELRITRRIVTGSRWLHDAIQICGDLFALAITDRNEVLFLDVASRSVVGRLSCEGKGGGPQFLSFSA